MPSLSVLLTDGKVGDLKPWQIQKLFVYNTCRQGDKKEK